MIIKKALKSNSNVEETLQKLIVKIDIEIKILVQYEKDD